MDDRQINRYLSLMQTPTSECNRDVKWEELCFHMIFLWEKNMRLTVEALLAIRILDAPRVLAYLLFL